MAKVVLNDARIEVDGNDISDHVSEVTVETTRDEVDVTAFGAANKETLAGLGDATISITAFQDFAATELDSILWPLSTDNVPFSVRVRQSSDPISATNPEYRLEESLMFGYSPIAGSVGEASTTEVEFRNAGQGGLTRAVA
jgi:hypothetical protein